MRIDKLSVIDGKCYLFKDRLNRRYFSGTDIAEGFLLIAEKPVYFTDLRYYSAAKDKISKSGITPCVYKSIDDLAAEIKAQNVKTVYIDYIRTTLSECEEYRKSFGDVKFADCSREITELRRVKDESETESIKNACAIAERAVNDAFSRLYEGMTEKELKKFVEDSMSALGGEGAAFDTIVAFGKNAAVPHHETGDAKLIENQVVLIDTGCKVNGYCSDITRTAFFGEPDDGFLKAYDAVLSANLKAEEEIYAGMSGKAADKIARDLLKARGYGEYFTHSLGHGVGLEIHESPFLSPKSCDILDNGTVFTVEPGVYMEGRFGIRVEDTCIMENGKAKRLFKDDKKPRIISAEK